ncbi:MAG TPA: hypothetical protein VEY11_11760 [Pyrinomonadaceae bacterium]|nr:hypothetical protein [Pyrinomonadaceae bacterium]
MRHVASYVFTLFLLIALLPSEVLAQTKSRRETAQKIESLREEIKLLEAELLAPARADREKFKEFLTQPDTGLIRLLPGENWDGKLSLRGGGAYYQFDGRTHEYGRGSDIHLRLGTFSVGFAGANFGFITQLGDVPLEQVTTDAESAGFLSTFAAPVAEPKAREQQRRSGHGFLSGELMYKSRLPALANNTYLLRSINYGLSDVLVAFRVVRVDEDGSMILLWKTLRKFSKPQLEK